METTLTYCIAGLICISFIGLIAVLICIILDVAFDINVERIANILFFSSLAIITTALLMNIIMFITHD